VSWSIGCVTVSIADGAISAAWRADVLSWIRCRKSELRTAGRQREVADRKLRCCQQRPCSPTGKIYTPGIGVPARHTGRARGHEHECACTCTCFTWPPISAFYACCAVGVGASRSQKPGVGQSCAEDLLYAAMVDRRTRTLLPRLDLTCEHSVVNSESLQMPCF